MNDIRQGLEIMVIGFSVVVFALFTLYLLLIAFNKYFLDKNKVEEVALGVKDSGRGSQQGTGTISTRDLSGGSSFSVQGSQPKDTYSETETKDPSELVAILTGVLAIYLEKPAASFRIKAVHPVARRSSWVQYGRTRMMDLRTGVGFNRREKRR